MKNKKKIRTCGNCINCVKVNPTNMCYSTYKCDCPFNDTYFLGRTNHLIWLNVNIMNLKMKIMKINL